MPVNDTQPNDGQTKEDLSTKIRTLQSHVAGQNLSSSITPSITENRTKRILIVDDDHDVTSSIKIGLECEDSSILAQCFNNPVNALLHFTPNLYDLLLVDINMPTMNGFELTEKILQKDTNIKICFMTAGEVNMDAVREVHSLRSIGCFIRKPITTGELVRRIRTEME